jgi:hypothetical protein
MLTLNELLLRNAEFTIEFSFVSFLIRYAGNVGPRSHDLSAIVIVCVPSPKAVPLTQVQIRERSVAGSIGFASAVVLGAVCLDVAVEGLPISCTAVLDEHNEINVAEIVNTRSR